MEMQRPLLLHWNSFRSQFGAIGQLTSSATLIFKLGFAYCKVRLGTYQTVRNLYFFVQKFNFDFPRKFSTFLGEKLAKMLRFWAF